MANIAMFMCTKVRIILLTHKHFNTYFTFFLKNMNDDTKKNGNISD